MSVRRVILCTGPPGNGRDELLKTMKEKTSFRYYHLFDYIVEQAKLEGTNLTKMNILDFYDSQPEKMEALRKIALARINTEINENGGVNIISTPHHFEWKGNRFNGFIHDDVEILNPDIFIVIFDDILRVRERLALDPQWMEHKYTLGEIANWRREELAELQNAGLIHKRHLRQVPRGESARSAPAGPWPWQHVRPQRVLFL